jgi:hypothetical protein
VGRTERCAEAPLYRVLTCAFIYDALYNVCKRCYNALLVCTRAAEPYTAAATAVVGDCLPNGSYGTWRCNWPVGDPPPRSDVTVPCDCW